jgi:gliding motility-associated-like protein
LKYFLLHIIALLSVYPLSFAQTGFSAPDTVCSGTSFTPVIDPSVTASSYFWHFCSDNLTNSPAGTNLGNIGQLNGPAFITIAQDNGNYYAFITNHVNRNLIRYQFGTSLLNNNPQADLLGTMNNLIPPHIEGIQIKKDNDGNWYGFMVGGLGSDTKLIRLEFGTSLNNTPTATDLGNIGNMTDPVDLVLKEDNGQWVGFTTNSNSNSITRFVFPNGLANMPTATNIGNIGQLNKPCGIALFPQNGTWHMFITNFNLTTNTYSLSRLNFANSLLNIPTGTNLPGAAELDSPFDLVLIRACDNPYGILVNHYNNNVVRMNFPNGIDGNITYTDVGNPANLVHPNGISDVYRENDKIFGFVTNIDNNTISRLEFSTCTEPSILTSTDRDPLPLSYAHAGIYNMSLLLDEGLSTETLYCKNILVIEQPKKTTWPKDTTVCPDKIVILNAGNGYAHYLWQDGSQQSSFTTPDTGTFWVHVSNAKKCEAGDTISIAHYPDNLSLGNDNSFVPGQAITLDAGSGYQSYTWWPVPGNNNSSITIIKPGTYGVIVTDSHSCIFRDTIRLTLDIDIQNFFTPNGDGFNDIWNPKVLFHYPEAEVKIFDRYGKLMTGFRGYDQGWNGIYLGKPVKEDTYWYIIDLKNGIAPYTGQVTVKR